jgi:hypothetical protein
MPKMRMSESCKTSMTEQFGFKSSKLVQIENFMNQHNQKTAKDILDSLMQDKKLDNKQKIVIAYVVGNSAREAAIKEDLQKGIKKDIDNIYINASGGVPPIGG